jgi:hypothetical protein
MSNLHNLAAGRNSIMTRLDLWRPQDGDIGYAARRRCTITIRQEEAEMMLPVVLHWTLCRPFVDDQSTSNLSARSLL